MQTIESIAATNSLLQLKVRSLEATLERLRDEVKPAAASTNWISVNDRLPDDGIDMLVALDRDGEVDVWVGHMEEDQWYLSDAMPVPVDCITHWAEMPEGPQ